MELVEFCLLGEEIVFEKIPVEEWLKSADEYEKDWEDFKKTGLKPWEGKNEQSRF